MKVVTQPLPESLYFSAITKIIRPRYQCMKMLYGVMILSLEWVLSGGGDVGDDRGGGGRTC